MGRRSGSACSSPLSGTRIGASHSTKRRRPGSAPSTLRSPRTRRRSMAPPASHWPPENAWCRMTLADSLRLISEEGSDALYEGRLGAAMAAAAQNGGGFLSEEDLRRNRAEWRETLGLGYRDHRVVTAAPPSTAWAALVRLGMMDRYDAGPADHNTTAYVHAATEISKRVSATTRRFAADLEKAPTPLGRL